VLELESLSLADLIRLREHLSEVLTRRFERNLAVAFTDVVGSTAYFAQFGDEAGRGLQQRHIDLITDVWKAHGGRIVDTAGDGAFSCFPNCDEAAEALIELQEKIQAQNRLRAREHHLTVRAGLHWGAVLTDGVVASGDVVNLGARVASSAQPSEIRVTRGAADELTSRLRSRCEPHGAVEMKGVSRPVELLVLRWREQVIRPTSVEITESGERFALPDKPVIRFGRLREHAGTIANDIVLSLPDKTALMRISRWHFELRHEGDLLFLHPVSEQGVLVDSRPVAKGERARVNAGTVVQISDVITLRFVTESSPESDQELRTFINSRAR
jgi:class 3 adenylate cyclase